MNIRKIPRAEYPALLRSVSGLKPFMDIVGEMPGDENKFLCVIGSRRHGDYGREACRKIISGLAGYPIVIVSGLAIGIDSIAHRAALDAGLKTLSFPGSGLDPSVLYPQRHLRLARTIIEKGGTLVSEFDRLQYSTDWTFPARNRLMAAISHAVLVIEARRGSGTLITTDFAGAFGRDIMAVPGSIFSDLSYGPHMLISRGAAMVTCAFDVLEALGFRPARSDGMPAPLPNFAEMSLSPQERALVDILRSEPMQSGDIMSKLSISPATLSALVSELELRGIVTEREGRYRLV